MKMVYCTCNISILEPLLEELRRNKVKDYQAVHEVTGVSVVGDPRLNTAVWPGYNSSVFIQFNDDDRAAEVIQVVRDFNKKAINENELVTCCTWTLDEYFYK